MFKELLLCACAIGVCSSAAINTLQSESDSIVPENTLTENDENATSDLETSETKFFGFGPKVVVINKGYGGYRGGGRRRGGCGCGYGHSHYHGHGYYGKKK
ncbi:hypothetical protein Bhyg_09430 [Pseudolycoriella hygida]|uniref:Glycine-rich protein n=1 Tax=Pseudolycoriella hygida TaxID=35572 RepID=A0A9Q0N6F6_9DIPT|nr:hypothetical protein Bhyg_09430 [Pseudolycoriella hygida]